MNIKTEFVEYICVLGSSKRVISNWVPFWVIVVDFDKTAGEGIGR